MLATIQSAGVAPEVILRNNTQVRKHASEKSTLALKPKADFARRPKQGYQWPHEKDLCQLFISSKNLLKKSFEMLLYWCFKYGLRNKRPVQILMHQVKYLNYV